MQWEQLSTTNTPEGRSSHIAKTAHLSNGKKVLVLYSGENAPRNAFDPCVHILDLDTLQWQTIHSDDSSPPQILGSAGSVVGDRLFIFGGRDNDKHDLDYFYAFDMVLHQWENLTGLPGSPVARSYHTMAAIDHNLYLFGGCSSVSGTFARLNDLHVFYTLTRSWSTLQTSSPAPSPRGGSSLVAVGQRLFVHGGFCGVEMDDLFEYDFTKQGWVDMPVAPAKRSVFVAAGLNDSEFIVFGGESAPSEQGHEGAGHYLNSTAVFNVHTASWSVQSLPSQSSIPPACAWMDGGVLDGKLYFFGGFDGATRLGCTWVLQ